MGNFPFPCVRREYFSHKYSSGSDHLSNCWLIAWWAEKRSYQRLFGQNNKFFTRWKKFADENNSIDEFRFGASGSGVSKSPRSYPRNLSASIAVVSRNDIITITKHLSIAIIWDFPNSTIQNPHNELGSRKVKMSTKENQIEQSNEVDEVT